MKYSINLFTESAQNHQQVHNMQQFIKYPIDVNIDSNQIFKKPIYYYCPCELQVTDWLSPVTLNPIDLSLGKSL